MDNTKRDRRLEILTLAQEQMMTGGYSALSFTDINQQLGISRANMHHHFKNKEGLAIQVTKDYIEQSLDGMYSMASKYRGNLPKILSIIEAEFLKRVKESGRRGTCVCTQILADLNSPDSLNHLSKNFFESKEKFLIKLIKESQEAGTISKKPVPQYLATMLTTILMGMAQKASVYGDDKRFTRSMKGVLTNYISAFES